jgi:5'-3' exonuclease
MGEGSSDETQMIACILETMESLISYANLQKTLYIAIDGVAPKAKMKQQRQRRHKSIFEPKAWDTNAISPGTHFMDKLNHHLDRWIQEPRGFQVILSNANEPGEGEHKILEYLRSQKTATGSTAKATAIYGLDADLIMLGLIASESVPNLMLLRERTEYNIEDCDNDYIYLKIPELKDFILKDIGVHNKLGDQAVINDYIFLCFMLGNDFINHMPALSLRYRGLETLLKTYRSLQETYQGYFQLIDTDYEDLIHLTFFKEFMVELAKHEPRLLSSVHGSRVKQSQRVIGKYRNEFQTFQSSLDHASKGTSHIKLKDIYGFLESYKNRPEHEEEMAKEMTENLPLFFVNQEQRYLKRDVYYKDQKAKAKATETANDVCQDFLDSLVWTAHYYFKGCRSWSWATQCERGPLLKDLSHYLQTKNTLSIPEDPHPMSIPEQLTFIFPPQSHRLHSHKVPRGPKETEIMETIAVDVMFCRYLWEAHVGF